MEYKTIINLSGNKPNQLSKFRTKFWVEINAKLQGTYNTDSLTKLKTSKLKSDLCDCSDEYILVSGTTKAAALAADGENNGIQVVFNYWAPLLIA